jgi:hypothetical protein
MEMGLRISRMETRRPGRNLRWESKQEMEKVVIEAMEGRG